MNAHPHSGVHIAWPFLVHMSPLDSYRSHEGVAGSRKCKEERVTLRVDLNALVCAERLTNYSAMLRDQVSVKFAEALQQDRRRLYVAEDKGNCARG